MPSENHRIIYQKGDIDVGKPDTESPSPYVVRIMQRGFDCCVHTIEGKPMDYVLLNEGIFYIRLESHVNVPLLAKMEVDGVFSRSNYRILPNGTHTIKDIRSTVEDRSTPLSYSRNKRHFEGLGATEEVCNGSRDIDYYCGLFRIFFFNVSEVVGGKWNVDSTGAAAVVMLRYGYFPHFQKVFPDCIQPFSSGAVKKAKPRLRDDKLTRVCKEYPTPGIIVQSVRTISGPPGCVTRYHNGASSRLSPYVEEDTRLYLSSRRPTTVCSEPYYTDEPIDINGKLVLPTAPISRQTSCISPTVRSPSQVVASKEQRSRSTQGSQCRSASSTGRQLPGTVNYSPVKDALTAADEEDDEYVFEYNNTKMSPGFHLTHSVRSQSQQNTCQRSPSSNYHDPSICHLRQPHYDNSRSISVHSVPNSPLGDTKSELIYPVSSNAPEGNSYVSCDRRQEGTGYSVQGASVKKDRVTHHIHLSPTKRASSGGYKLVVEVSPLSRGLGSNSVNGDIKILSEQPSYSERREMTNTTENTSPTGADINHPNQLTLTDKHNIVADEKITTVLSGKNTTCHSSSTVSTECNVTPSADISRVSNTVSILQAGQKYTKSELEKAKQETLQWKRRYRDLALAHERHDVSGLVSLSGSTNGMFSSMNSVRRSVIRRLSLSKELNEGTPEESPSRGIIPNTFRSKSCSIRSTVNESDMDPVWSSIRKSLSSQRNGSSEETRSQTSPSQTLGSLSDGIKCEEDAETTVDAGKWSGI